LCLGEFFAVIKKCEKRPVDPDFRDDFSMNAISLMTTSIIVPVQNIQEMCVYTCIAIDKYYSCRKVNSTESE
jgi:hypothetical protein